MVGVLSKIQGIVQHGRKMILPVLLGTDVARRLLKMYVIAVHMPDSCHICNGICLNHSLIRLICVILRNCMYLTDNAADFMFRRVRGSIRSQRAFLDGRRNALSVTSCSYSLS